MVPCLQGGAGAGPSPLLQEGEGEVVGPPCHPEGVEVEEDL